MLKSAAFVQAVNLRTLFAGVAHMHRPAVEKLGMPIADIVSNYSINSSLNIQRP